MEEATSHKQGGDSASTSPVFKGDNSGQYFSPQQDIIFLSPLKVSFKYLLTSLLPTLANSEPISP